MLHEMDSTRLHSSTLSAQQALVSRLCDAGLNPDTLRRLSALDPTGTNAFLPQAFSVFCDQLEEQAQAMETAVEQGAFSTVRSIAHMVRSSSLAVGAEVFSSACLQLDHGIGAAPSGADLTPLRDEALAVCRAARALRGAILDALAA